jgi:CO/xanthine dehydrogenase FAD-binding subunit
MEINRFNSHIIPIRFDYHAPKSLKEAVRLLDEYGEEAQILAGGTDLIPKIKQRILEPKHVINLKAIPELACIKETPDGFKIGALTKLRTIELSNLINEKLPVLGEAARAIGSVQIRNRGTVGGNLCNASPCADTATVLMVLNAVARVDSNEGRREVPIGEFFDGRGQTILAPNEMLHELTIPPLPEGTGSAFVKVGWTTFDIATVNVAVVLRLDDEKVVECRIALGACSPAPFRVHNAEEALKGKRLTNEALEEAAHIVSEHIEPRERWRRAPPEYRRKTSKALALEALTRAAEKARRLAK